jgi:hypothetical protein
VLRRRLLAPVLAFLVSAGPAAAQPAAPDPLAAQTFATTWLWREITWSTAAGRAEGWGGRMQGQLGLGRLGLTVRADVGGLPQSFALEDPATFQSLQGYLAAHYNVAGAAGAVVGPTAFVGRAISLEEGHPSSAPTEGGVTAGVGLRVGADAGAGYLAVGTHEALGGFCVLGTVHLPLTSRLAAVADGAIGAHGRTYVRVGMAVLLAQGGR